MTVDARTILLVEDDDDYRATLEATFADEGYRVLAAPDGNAALIRLGAEATPPALIVLDWVMPAWDGLDFLRALEADARHDATPLIVLADVSTTSRIPSTRVTAVVTKPVRTRTLLDMVGRLSGATVPEPRKPKSSQPRTAWWRAARSIHLRPTALLRKPIAVEQAPTGRHRR